MSRWSRFVAVALLGALVCSAVPSWAGAQMRVTEAPVAVKIAVAGSTTQGATAWGEGAIRGTSLAVSDYSAELASAGVSVTLLEEDDKADPTIASTVATEIVADSAVMGVVGHLYSSCSIAGAQVYNPAHLVMITPTATNPALTQQGLNDVFRTCGTDASQGIYAADTILNNLRLRRAFVVDDASPYGTTVGNAFSHRFGKSGGKVAGYASTSYSASKYSALVRKIKSKKPDVVYFGGTFELGSMLAEGLKKAGVNALFAGPDGLYTPEFILATGAKRAEGDMATSVGLPLSQQPGGLAYKQKNVYLVPGQYVHYEFPGSEDYVKGANRQLSDQMLFGSVYPNCGPLKEVRQIVDALGFASEEIKTKYLEGNARRLLGLTPG